MIDKLIRLFKFAWETAKGIVLPIVLLFGTAITTMFVMKRRRKAFIDAISRAEESYKKEIDAIESANREVAEKKNVAIRERDEKLRQIALREREELDELSKKIEARQKELLAKEMRTSGSLGPMLKDVLERSKKARNE